MNAVLAKEEYNGVLEEVKAFSVREGRRPRILVAKMGQDGKCAHCTHYFQKLNVLRTRSVYILHDAESNQL